MYWKYQKTINLCLFILKKHNESISNAHISEKHILNFFWQFDISHFFYCFFNAYDIMYRTSGVIFFIDYCTALRDT